MNIEKNYLNKTLYASSSINQLMLNETITSPLQDIINSTIKSGQEGSLLMLEINNLMVIIEVYGHEFASRIITELNKQITKILPQDADVFYDHREYFYIVLKGKEINLEETVKEVHKEIQYFGCNNPEFPVHIMCSLGSVTFPKNTTQAVDAVDKAYIALKSTKKDIYSFYCSFEDVEQELSEIKNKMNLAHTLKNAFANKQFRLAFQPIVSTTTGKSDHYECLLRIITDSGKLVSAGPFIPIAEEMSFINLIDEIVLEMVVEELNYSKDVHLAFNLSSMGVYNKEWLFKAKKLLSDPEVASRVTIEMTETAAQKDLSYAAYFVAAMQDLGCRVALDDFGSGNTSFRQLSVLSVDYVKIDGSYIRDIVSNNNSLLFVHTLLTMTKGMGFQTVAEYVENGEIAKMLMKLKIDYMQGNYLSPAVNHRLWLDNN